MTALQGVPLVILFKLEQLLAIIWRGVLGGKPRYYGCLSKSGAARWDWDWKWYWGPGTGDLEPTPQQLPAPPVRAIIIINFVPTE